MASIWLMTFRPYGSKTLYKNHKMPNRITQR